MKEIPTAEEICHKYISFWQPLSGYEAPLPIKNAMIEFAKLHVKAALKEAAHKSECYNKSKFPGDENWVVDIESILNAYPLTNIK
jgi:hypothetical protein